MNSSSRIPPFSHCAECFYNHPGIYIQVGLVNYFISNHKNDIWNICTVHAQPSVCQIPLAFSVHLSGVCPNKCIPHPELWLPLLLLDYQFRKNIQALSCHLHQFPLLLLPFHPVAILSAYTKSPVSTCTIKFTIWRNALIFLLFLSFLYFPSVFHKWAPLKNCHWSMYDGLSSLWSHLEHSSHPVDSQYCVAELVIQKQLNGP